MSQIMLLIFFLSILLFSITFHEYCHAWAADKLGDPTAKELGRLTINPLAHIDPFGTVILPLTLFFLSGGSFTIGWAKPVPINPNQFKNPKKDLKWIGASGPLANLILATLLALLVHLGFPGKDLLLLGIFINLLLAVFNLLPIPPLDGSRIVASFLPPQTALNYLKIEPYGFFIVIALVYLGFFRLFLIPIVTLLFNLLGLRVSL